MVIFTEYIKCESIDDGITGKASEFVQEDAMHTEVVPDSEDTPTIATELPNTVQSSTPTEAAETSRFIIFFADLVLLHLGI